MVTVHWPRWLPCPYMVKTFKHLLQNQISPGALFLHKSSGTDLPKLLKWWFYVDVWPFYGKVRFASPCMWMGLWALYIYMRKMLRIHILDISSIIHWNLMMSIGALMRHKIAKWADRKSKMATTAAIMKINFQHFFSNLRLLWTETCSLATGWLLDRNKLKLFRSKFQDGRNGSAPLNKMAARAKK